MSRRELLRTCTLCQLESRLKRTDQEMQTIHISRGGNLTETRSAHHDVQLLLLLGICSKSCRCIQYTATWLPTGSKRAIASWTSRPKRESFEARVLFLSCSILSRRALARWNVRFPCIQYCFGYRVCVIHLLLMERSRKRSQRSHCLASSRPKDYQPACQVSRC